MTGVNFLAGMKQTMCLQQRLFLEDFPTNFACNGCRMLPVHVARKWYLAGASKATYFTIEFAAVYFWMRGKSTFRGQLVVTYFTECWLFLNVCQQMSLHAGMYWLYFPTKYTICGDLFPHGDYLVMKLLNKIISLDRHKDTSKLRQTRQNANAPLRTIHCWRNFQSNKVDNYNAKLKGRLNREH